MTNTTLKNTTLKNTTLKKKSASTNKKRLTLAGFTLAALTLGGAVIAHAGMGHGGMEQGFGHSDCKGSHKGHGYHQGQKSRSAEEMAQHQEKMTEKRISRMQQHLELSDDQVKQLKVLMQQHNKPMDEGERRQGQHLMAIDPSASDYDRQVQAAITQRQEMVAEKMQARAEFHKALHGILTPAQQEKLQQWRDQPRKDS